MGFPKIGFAKRLLVLYGIIFVLVLLVTDWTLSHVLQERDLRQLQKSLSHQSTLIREIATPMLKNVPQLQSEMKKLAAGTEPRITIIDPGELYSPIRARAWNKSPKWKTTRCGPRSRPH